MTRDRSHLVPLPFPLLGLYLKVMPLLLPTGSSTRKVPNVHEKVTHDEFDEKPKNHTVEVKGRKKTIYSPAKVHVVFFKSDREVLNTSSVKPLRRPELRPMLMGTAY